MKLLQVKIKNFRCYREETTINISNLTALIGKNDVGKSSILEALEIFFNNEVVKIDPDDLNKEALAVDDTKVEITCIFEDLPDEIILDTASPTSLASEYLLNRNGKLEIKKYFACALKTPKETVFIKAYYPSAKDVSDLHQLKKAELKTRATSLQVASSQYNANINSSIRLAIWHHISELQKTDTEIPIDKEDAKKIWDILKTYMPVYALFQSDRESREDDKEVTDPMKVAIREALREVEADLLRIQEIVKTKAIEVANRTLVKLRDMNPDLASELRPDFKKDPAWGGIFALTLSSDNNIPINKRGSGVRRLILLNFFRAEAERRRIESTIPNIIYAFEEPETSQHPDHQIMLVNAFKELSGATNTQVLLTTHTPALGGILESESLRLITLDNRHRVIIEEGNNAAYEKIAKTLGVLPDPMASQVQLMVCVEGPNDVTFLKHVSNLISQADPTLPNLGTDPRIVVFPLGGGTLKQWVNNNYLAGLNKIEFHIYDRDDMINPPYQQAAADVIARGNNHFAVLTVKRETENYIHYDVVNRKCGILIAPFLNTDDVPDIVAQAIHIAGGGTDLWATMNYKKKKDKVSNAKRMLCNEVVADMTIQEFSIVDAAQEIMGWHRQIAQRLH